MLVLHTGLRPCLHQHEKTLLVTACCTDAGHASQDSLCETSQSVGTLMLAEMRLEILLMCTTSPAKSLMHTGFDMREFAHV